MVKIYTLLQFIITIMYPSIRNFDKPDPWSLNFLKNTIKCPTHWQTVKCSMARTSIQNDETVDQNVQNTWENTTVNTP